MIASVILAVCVVLFCACGKKEDDKATVPPAITNGTDQGAATNAGDAAGEAARNAGDAVGEAVTNAGDAVGDIVTGAGDVAGDAITGAADAVSDAVSDIAR